MTVVPARVGDTVLLRFDDAASMLVDVSHRDRFGQLRGTSIGTNVPVFILGSGRVVRPSTRGAQLIGTLADGEVLD